MTTTPADILKAANHRPYDAGHVSHYLRTIARDGPPCGMEPPYELLRNTIRKMIPTHLWIIGGYTSVGKTLLVIDLLMRLITQHNPSIALFSTEMACTQYVYRMLAWCTGVPSLRLMYGTMSDSEMRAYTDGCHALEHSKIYLYDNLYSFPAIVKVCQTIKTQGLDVVIIDFLQNLSGKGSIYERMSVLAPRLQALAKELDITLIALSQVSNEAARGETGIIGYKGAGEIATAADLGLWMERSKEDSEIVRVKVAKNRHGPRGQRNFSFVNNWTQLDEQPQNHLSQVEGE
jgi:replicative DNA helicase